MNSTGWQKTASAIKKDPYTLCMGLSWCDREDSNLWPSGSENYDTARNMMIYCDFLLVLHCYGTPITSSIKQCANDKN